MTRSKRWAFYQAGTGLSVEGHRTLNMTSIIWSNFGLGKYWRIFDRCSTYWRYGCLQGNSVAYIPKALWRCVGFSTARDKNSEREKGETTLFVQA